jgi:undecaprenyl-phosphate 4-deoxy-4-formamido-L-arabinose transferase
MDEDLQHAPEDIEKLIYQQQKGDFDVVYGKYETRQHSGIRNLGSSVLKKIIDIGVPDIHPDYSAFRLLKVSVAKSLIGMRNSYTFLDGYLSWITSNCSSCVVSHSERQGGVSAYTFQKLVNHTINIFVTFSNLPIRLLTTLSFVVLTFMSLYSAYVLIRKLIFNDLALGYSSLIIIIGFGVGIIMLALGIIGEYIYRINLKTTKRPNYNVNEVL